MSATVLSTESAKQANLNLVEGHQGKQALNDVLVAYRANRRQGNAHTKSRAEVSGSGKKLWNQKGTGNARMGSKRSPIWSGGGVVFGPKTRDYSKKTTKNVRKLALRTALTARIVDGAVSTISDFAVADGKTKSFVSAVASLSTAKKTLIVGSFDELTFRSARNVQNVQLISAEEVNAEHLLLYPQVLVTTDALPTLARRTA
ncbi:large subunit ribosomal protein L4 [Prosthecobacter debontii]|uniref:Large ribosomal subunit protein uL4 n=1 Tax=Prosthecobacter debontii TaxID=48467 RepID=A0A1T4YWX4_9BACT|nr:50S ribosomal protein L4 [Prosthecobacter debontii]SKB06290.1 large subunit ribosomal protein L4 [Prosthecobacter debontii]